MKLKAILTLGVAFALTAFMSSCGSKETTDKNAETSEETQETTESNKSTEANKASEVVEFALPDGEAVFVLDNDNLISPEMEIDRPVVLDFNATWCGPCQSFAPVFDEVAKKYAGQVNFASIDIDANPITAGAFGIQSIPTVVVMVPGQPEKVFVGTGDLMPADKFEQIVLAAINDMKGN